MFVNEDPFQDIICLNKKRGYTEKFNFRKAFFFRVIIYITLEVDAYRTVEVDLRMQNDLYLKYWPV